MVSVPDRPRSSALTALVRRLLDGALTAWGAVTFTFLALRLSVGDPVAALLSQGLTTAEQAAQLRSSMGYDLPLPDQYWLYLRGLLGGDLGRSLYTGLPVSQIIRSQFPPTLQLALSSLIVTIGIGLVLGFASAWSGYPRVRSLAAFFSSLAVALPVATTGMLSLTALAAALDRPAPWARTLVPALVLGYALAGPLARAVRSSLEETLNAPYAIAARGRGLANRLLWHALRPALPPVIALLALEAAFVIGGTVIIESVFARAGLGRTLVQSILQSDFPVAQGIVVVAALSYVASQVAGDFLAAVIDPRLRSE